MYGRDAAQVAPTDETGCAEALKVSVESAVGGPIVYGRDQAAGVAW